MTKKVLDFMKYKWLYFLLSGTALVISIFALIFWGFKPSVDFTGGTILELEATASADLEGSDINTIAKELGLSLESVQPSGDSTYLLRLKEIDLQKKDTLLIAISKKFGPIVEVSFSSVGPTLGTELIKKTIIAIILAAGFIMYYVTSRFKDKKFGVCAILAMFHDTLILLGTFAVLGHFAGVEIDTLFVTAVLTILSFSVHDTIVVYDRIREGQKMFPRAAFVDLVNKAVAETLGRSVNNSMTIIFMLLVLFLLGGQTIHWFILALLVGTVAGTYSSTFTAAPLLVVWERLKKK